MTDCGDAGGESCCTSLGVPCGTYYRTYNTAGSLTGPPDGGWPDEADPATISGFRLDEYDVTVGRFRQFVNAVLPPDGGTGWLPTPGSGKHTHLNGGLGLANSAAQTSDLKSAVDARAPGDGGHGIRRTSEKARLMRLPPARPAQFDPKDDKRISAASRR